MSLTSHLATLEAWGLIQPVVAGAQLEYRFRHALVHEAAYSTLLKQNRRELHRAVGEVLEAAGPAAEETVPLLAFHFSEAGEKERAKKTSQPRLVAHSYNRLGNWQLNVERPREAAGCHDQALAIFEALHDDEGMAETLDLLGMSSILGGDLARGVHYYQQAIDINRRLGNQLALAHCLGSQLLA